MAAETGHLDLAYDYWGEAALMDLDDLEHNTGDGLHIASLAGSWLVAVAGFGGLRDTADGTLSFQPRLPGALRGLTFNLLWRGTHLNVAISPVEARYTCNGESHLDLLHYGETLRVGPGGTQVRDIPPVTAAAAAAPATRPRAGPARPQAGLGQPSAGPRRSGYASPARTTVTGHGACVTQCMLTEPSSIPVNAPRPLCPTTSRSASPAWSIRASAECP